MAPRTTYDEATLAKKHLDLVQHYLELQRLRIEVERAEFQFLKQKGGRQRNRPTQVA
jgi:hypothetical protein